MEIYSKTIKKKIRKGDHHIWRSMALKSLISGIDNKISNQMYHQMMLQAYIYSSFWYYLTFLLFLSPHLLRNCSYVGESLPEDHKHTAGAAAQGRSSAVKGRVSSAQNDHSTTELRQHRTTATHPWNPRKRRRRTRKSEKEGKNMNSAYRTILTQWLSRCLFTKRCKIESRSLTARHYQIILLPREPDSPHLSVFVFFMISYFSGNVLISVISYFTPVVVLLLFLDAIRVAAPILNAMISAFLDPIYFLT